MQCSITATTVDSLVATTSSTTPSPVPFDLLECISSMENRAQYQYICFDNPKLFNLLKYAEGIARHVCEEHFAHDLWNCSHFSLLKEPKISTGSSKFVLILEGEEERFL